MFNLIIISSCISQPTSLGHTTHSRPTNTIAIPMRVVGLKKKKTKKPCNSHWITFIQTKQCITIKWVLRETQNRRQVRNEMTKHLIIKTDTKYGFDSNSFFLFLFFKSSPEDIFSLLLEREERRGEGRETLMWERSVDWLPPVSTWNRDWTHNLCMCPDQASNPQPFDYRIWHSNQLSQTAQGQAP